MTPAAGGNIKIPVFFEYLGRVRADLRDRERTACAAVVLTEAFGIGRAENEGIVVGFVVDAVSVGDEEIIKPVSLYHEWRFDSTPGGL